MPYKSKAQARTFRAIVHGWRPPKSSGINISQKTAQWFDKDAGSQKVSRLPERVKKCSGGAMRKNW